MIILSYRNLWHFKLTLNNFVQMLAKKPTRDFVRAKTYSVELVQAYFLSNDCR